jgi:cobalamin biosynthesis protein CobT
MAKTLVDEIGDMLGDLSSEGPKESEETTEVEETEVEAGDAESTDSEVVEEDEDGGEEETAEEVSESEDEVEEEPGEAEETDEGEEPEKEPDDVESLRAQYNKAAELLLQHGITLPLDEGETPVETTKVETPAVETPAALSLEELAILEEDVDFDDVMNDRETFVKTMRGILDRYRGLLAQDFTRTIPGVVANQVRQVSVLTNAVNQFYRENEDLLPVRKAVGAVANQVVAEHPDWDLPKIMAESADRTRKILKIKKPKKLSNVVKPSFAKSKGGGKERKPKVKVSKLQSEIDEILD